MTDDWTIADTDTAAAILLYLGIGSEASKEPFADRRRDEIAKIIRKRVDYEIAQEREGCAFAAECHSGFGDWETIQNCASLIRARAGSPDDCVHVRREVYERLLSTEQMHASGHEALQGRIEDVARALAPGAWERHDTIVGFFVRGEDANEYHETYMRMCRADITTADAASAWLLQDDSGWTLQDSLHKAERAVAALSRTANT